MKDYVTVSEAADILGLTRQTILHHIKVGRLPAERFGRSWSIRRADAEAFAPPKAGWPRGKQRPHDGQ